MSADSPGDESSGTRFDYQQVSFVLLAALALVLAAFFVPALAGDETDSPELDPSGDTDPESGEPGTDSGDGPDISFDWDRLLDWLDIDGDSGGDSTIESGDDGTLDACTVVLNRRPVPGSEVTATISYQGQPLVAVPVRFNDRSVGETNAEGRVTGEVPYAEELIVHVGADDDTNCRARGPAAASTVVTTKQAIDSAIGTVMAGAGTVMVGSETVMAGTGTIAVDSNDSNDTVTTAQTSSAQASTSDESNSTATYDVDGDVEITVFDDPDPGESIELRAAIEGEPMRDASVAVDGESVTSTDDDGTATISVPDDGTERVDVRVARGDFAGTVTIDVLLLEAQLVPGGLAPVPGSDGFVAAEIAGEPVQNAAVAIDGDQRGTTDANGRLAIELPRDPTATVTVTTADQTATVTLVGAYGGVALLFSLLVAGLGTVAYRTYGVRGPIGVAGFATGLTGVLVVEAFYGTRAGLVVLTVLAAVGLAAVVRSKERVRSPNIRKSTGGFSAWLVDRVLALVGVLEVLVDRLRAVFAGVISRTASLPRSLTGLASILIDWLRSLQESASVATRRLARWRRQQPHTAVAILIGAASLLAGGYVVGDRTGFLLVGVGLAIVGVFVRAGRETEEASEHTADETMSTADSDAIDDARPSFRELWRSVARQVAPGQWRTCTPGEIERRALEAGYPSEPIRELTTLFREVEYGDRPLSNRLRERAEAAAAALHRTESATADREQPDASSSADASTTDGPTGIDSAPNGDRP